MAKDPAFLFYPNDYIGGTMGMTFEEKGAYIELLMLQFNRGHMDGHMIGHCVGKLWESIKCKFIQDENNLWYNERLDIEKAKRKAFSESRRNNIKGKNQHMKGHMTTHMENVNEDVNKTTNIKIVETKEEIILPFDSDEFKNNWDIWKDYKQKQFNFKYKTSRSQILALKDLEKLSENNEDIAIKIIEQSMANGWKGFFKLKNELNENNKSGFNYVERPSYSQKRFEHIASLRYVGDGE